MITWLRLRRHDNSVSNVWRYLSIFSRANESTVNQNNLVWLISMYSRPHALIKPNPRNKMTSFCALLRMRITVIGQLRQSLHMRERGLVSMTIKWRHNDVECVIICKPTPWQSYYVCRSERRGAETRAHIIGGRGALNRPNSIINNGGRLAKSTMIKLWM